MKARYDKGGRLKVQVDSQFQLVQKINLPNISDGLIYTLGCENDPGTGNATLYLISGGTVKWIGTTPYIRNDDTGKYHEIICHNDAGTGNAILSLGDGIDL